MSEVKTNKISSVSTNGDITLDPDGTGNLIVASGNVGIGTASPDTIADIAGSGVPLEIDSTNSNTYKVQFKNNGTVTSYLGTTSNAFYFGNSSAAQLARLDSDGLKFGTDSAAENALDDYEEGTWTPAFATSGTGFSSIGYYTQKGRYVKVGRQVHTWFFIGTNALTQGSASGAIQVTGLPYTVENVDYQSGALGYSQTWVTNHPTSLLGSPNQTLLFLYHSNGSTAHTNTTTSNMVDHSSGNKHFVYGALSYRSA